MEQPSRRTSNLTALHSISSSGDRLRKYTAKDYAERVRAYASITASHSFQPGDSLRNLADFLWQPYLLRAAQIDVSSSPAPVLNNTHHPISPSPSSSRAGPDSDQHRQQACPPFASIYHYLPGSTTMRKIPFETVKEFEELGEAAVPDEPGSFAFLVLQGYPCAEWLNTLGARFQVDPEFLHRHLAFASASSTCVSGQEQSQGQGGRRAGGGERGGGGGGRAGPARRDGGGAPRILPSRHGDMISLQVPSIGTCHRRRRHGGVVAGDGQATLDCQRQEAAEEMATYMDKLASLNASGIQPGDSVVREFSLYAGEYFSLEQALSMSVMSLGKGKGWLGIIWTDDGAPLSSGLKGPWQPTNTMHPSSDDGIDLNYIPVSSHTPNVALRSRRRARLPASSPAPPPGTSDPFKGSPPKTKMDLLMEDYGRIIHLQRAALDPFYALSPIFNSAVSSEMALLDLIGSRIRDDLDHTRLIYPIHEPTLSNLLYYQQVLNRHIQSLQTPISFMEVLLEEPQRPAWFNITGTNHSTGESTVPIPATTQLEASAIRQGIRSAVADYRAALAYAESLLAECVQGMSIVGHNASIGESQRARAEAREVTKLTKLATVYVPLGFVTALFSMNVKEINANDGPPIWQWAVVAVVVGILTWFAFRFDLVALTKVLNKRYKALFRGQPHQLDRSRTSEGHLDRRFPAKEHMV